MWKWIVRLAEIITRGRADGWWSKPSPTVKELTPYERKLAKRRRKNT